MVTGEYDNGYWISLSPEMYLPYPSVPRRRQRCRALLEVWQRTLFGNWRRTFDLVVGEQLEIIQPSDLFKVKPGEKLVGESSL
jgi:hypothetical protein